MTIIEGALLTVLIVFLFLGSWRSTVITGLTLPIAVIATFISLRVFGFTLNYMTMMALSLCIGLLIDDAIVVRENIVRHIHMGKDHYTAAREGTDEIGLAVLATTFSIVAVFVPIAFMGGIVGKFFYPFGITVAVAVLVSMFVSFTLDPMLVGGMARSAARHCTMRASSARCCAASIDSWIASMRSMAACSAGCCRRANGRLAPLCRSSTFPLGLPSFGFVAGAAHARRPPSETALCDDQPARNHAVDCGAEFCARNSDCGRRRHGDDAGE